MTVTHTCVVPGGAVELRLGAGERLRYTIGATADVVFELQDHRRRVLLSSDNGGRVREWPLAEDGVPERTFVTHPLGMQFGAAGRVQWTVELLDAGGQVREVVKDCTYTNDRGTDEFFDGLLIVLK